jgi:hypothetical protein
VVCTPKLSREGERRKVSIPDRSCGISKSHFRETPSRLLHGDSSDEDRGLLRKSMVPRAGFEFCLCGEIDWIVIGPDMISPHSQDLVVL